MNFIAVGPEIIIISTAIFLLLVDIIIPLKHRDWIGYISLLGLTGALVFAAVNWSHGGEFVLSTMTIDNLTSLIRIAIIIAGILVNLGAIKNTYTITNNQGEFFSLLLFSIAGASILAGGRELITIYVGLELSTIPVFILVAFRKAKARTGEAVIKFFILGLLSSAFLLYGLSLIYGLTGYVDIAQIANSLAKTGMTPALAIASMLVIAGFGFKITAIPFHFWAPDTYQGAPVIVISYLATVSKLGAYTALSRIFIQALRITQVNWALWFGVLATVTMILGNLMALPQTNIKRMMAYSGIAHAGYLLVGFAVGTNASISAMFFYLIAYVFSAIGIFFVISVHSAKGNTNSISSYAGMAQTNPVLSLVMVICFLSLIGLPPFAGFWGKLYLAKEAVLNNQAYLALLLFINSVLSVGYYIKVIGVVYLKKPGADKKPIVSPVTTSLALAGSTFLIFYIGFIQNPVLSIAQKIFTSIKL